jgi:tRNA(Ile)-lysidine synthetase-like protein
MVLLDLFARHGGYELIVAHFDHGLRPGSSADRAHVEAAAQRLGLTFVHHEARLGRASEAAARSARHAWLESVRRGHRAAAVVTAHHQDDLLETSLLNLARGTGRRGLAPMHTGTILRPLLALARTDLRVYAQDHKITWSEDPTNTNLTNPRNFLRHRLLPSATPAWTKRYLGLVKTISTLNKKIDQTLAARIQTFAKDSRTYSIPRETVQELSLPELTELILATARSLDPALEPGHRAASELALFAKTSPPHRHRALRSGLDVAVDADAVRVVLS